MNNKMLTAFFSAVTAFYPVYSSHGKSDLLREIDNTSLLLKNGRKVSLNNAALRNSFDLRKNFHLISNIEERINMTTNFHYKMHEDPRTLMEQKADFEYVRLKMKLLRGCSLSLMFLEPGNDDAIVTGWRLRASWLDDLQELLAFTSRHIEKIDREGARKLVTGVRLLPLTGIKNFKEDRKRQAESSEIQTIHYWVIGELYSFWQQGFFLNELGNSFGRLSAEAQPQFVEQIKKDFFHRDGMKYVDRTQLPDAFKEEQERMGVRDLELEKKIQTAPREWSENFNDPAISNNWSMLSRVLTVSESNINERFRLVSMLHDRLRLSPEEFVEGLYTWKSIQWELNFTRDCVWSLFGPNQKWTDVVAAWKRVVQWADDIEQLQTLTRARIRNVCPCSKPVSKRLVGPRKENLDPMAENKRMREICKKAVHYEQSNFWKTEFVNLVKHTFQTLAPKHRAAFVEFIKENFFHRGGMKHVDLMKLPKEFQENAGGTR